MPLNPNRRQLLERDPMRDELDRRRDRDTVDCKRIRCVEETTEEETKKVEIETKQFVVLLMKLKSTLSIFRELSETLRVEIDVVHLSDPKRKNDLNERKNFSTNILTVAGEMSQFDHLCSINTKKFNKISKNCYIF